MEGEYSLDLCLNSTLSLAGACARNECASAERFDHGDGMVWYDML